MNHKADRDVHYGYATTPELREHLNGCQAWISTGMMAHLARAMGRRCSFPRTSFPPSPAPSACGSPGSGGWRRCAELEALELYFLLAASRNDKTNAAHICY